MKDVWPHLAVLLVASLLLYAQVLGFGFLNFDDDIYLFNDLVHQWTQQPWSDRLLTPLLGYPLAVPVALYAAAVELFSYHAAGLHALNWLFHVANVGLLWGVLRNLTKNPWAATMGAAAWAFHPALAESVSWIASLKEVCLVFGCLLSVFAFERYRATSKHHWIGVAAFGVLWAVFSKPTGIALGPILIVIGFVVHREDTKKFLKVVTFGGVCALAAATILAVIAYSSHDAYGGQSSGFSLDRIIAAAAIQIQNYVVPLNFSPIYPYEGVPFEAWIFVPGITLILLGLAYQFRTTAPLVTAGILWLFIAYAPTSNLIVLGRFTTTSYAYFPTVGVALVVAGIIDRYYEGRPEQKLLIPFIVMCLLGSTLSFLESSTWRDATILWANAVDRRPDNHFAQLKLGQALYDHGEYKLAIETFEKIPPKLYGPVVAFPSRWGLAHCRLGQKKLCAQLLVSATLSAERAETGIAKRVANNALLHLAQAYREFELDESLLPPKLRQPVKDSVEIRLP